jgi:hypothetical protein
MTKATSMFKSEGYITLISPTLYPKKEKKAMDTYFEPATVRVTILL